MLTGVFKRETPTPIQKYLGLSPALLKSHNPDLAACTWPFRGITRHPDGFKVENMDDLQNNLPQLKFRNSQEILCTRFVEARRQFFYPINPTEIQRKSRSAALNVIRLAVDVVLFFQMKGNTTNAQDSLGIMAAFKADRVSTHRISHCSSIKIIDKLLSPSGRLDKRFSVVSQIIERITLELGSTCDVRNEMASRIATLVEESGYPFLVTIGSTDYVTVVSESQFPLQSNIKRAWVRALIEINRGRVSSVTGGNLSRLIKVFFEYGKENSTNTISMTTAAKTIQKIYDDNDIPRNCTSEIARKLLATWRNDHIGKTLTMLLRH